MNRDPILIGLVNRQRDLFLKEAPEEDRVHIHQVIVEYQKAKKQSERE